MGITLFSLFFKLMKSKIIEEIFLKKIEKLLFKNKIEVKIK